MTDQELLELAFSLAAQAGDAILAIRSRGFETMHKADASLVTEAEARGVTVEFHSPGRGDVADALIATAESVRADLVVVGNKGMTGVSRFILGSIPNKVAHHCRCSVLIAYTDTETDTGTDND